MQNLLGLLKMSVGLPEGEVPTEGGIPKDRKRGLARDNIVSCTYIAR